MVPLEHACVVFDHVRDRGVLGMRESSSLALRLIPVSACVQLQTWSFPAMMAQTWCKPRKAGVSRPKLPTVGLLSLLALGLQPHTDASLVCAVERAARSFPLARLPEGLQTADPGATYYRQFFHGQGTRCNTMAQTLHMYRPQCAHVDHLTFVGESEAHGYILISVRREAVPVLGASPTTRPEPMTSLMHYRAIVRTSKVG